MTTTPYRISPESSLDDKVFQRILDEFEHSLQNCLKDIEKFRTCSDVGSKTVEDADSLVFRCIDATGSIREKFRALQTLMSGKQ